ncbi:MAG TPA: SGNH/GDSL hydrolase family protein [Candidatus Nanoarchaeia archaeon]|nr:SGNH/GDSL hydrolase family protein [Candidatus Nanoarchaeia archaeon]
MKIANKIEVNSILVLVVVITGLLIIDLLVIPWYINYYYLDDFRTNFIGIYPSFMTFASSYEYPKVYFFGDSIFWGEKIGSHDTIPAYFEKCSGKKAFNLALSGARIYDLLFIMNNTKRDALIVFEIDHAIFNEGKIRTLYINMSNSSYISNRFGNFPNLYTQRHVLQLMFFGKSTKDRILEYLQNKPDQKEPDFFNPTPNLGMTKDGLKELNRFDKYKILFVAVPIFNNNSWHPPIINNADILDLSNLNLTQDYYKDYQHFSEKGSKLIAEEICEAVR